VGSKNAHLICPCPMCGARKGQKCTGVKRGLGVHSLRLDRAWLIAENMGIPEIKTRKKHLQNQKVTRRGRDKFQRHTYVVPRFVFRLLQMFAGFTGARGKAQLEKYVGELLHCDMQRLCDEHLHGISALRASALLRDGKTYEQVNEIARAVR
jgi:hypothetical protein